MLTQTTKSDCIKWWTIDLTELGNYWLNLKAQLDSPREILRTEKRAARLSKLFFFLSDIRIRW